MTFLTLSAVKLHSFAIINREGSNHWVLWKLPNSNIIGSIQQIVHFAYPKSAFRTGIISLFHYRCACVHWFVGWFARAIKHYSRRSSTTIYDWFELLRLVSALNKHFIQCQQICLNASIWVYIIFNVMHMWMNFILRNDALFVLLLQFLSRNHLINECLFHECY